MILESLINSSVWQLAQTAPRGWADALLEMETDKLVVLLLFGTGLIGAIGYSIAKILRAANGSPEDFDDLKTQVEELQQRVTNLEQNHR